jgi:phosphate transport system permease protein
MNLKTRYQLYGIIFQVFCLAANVLALVFLLVLLVGVLFDGASFLSLDFLSNYPSRVPEKAGILSAIVGSISMMGLTALFAIPMGIGAAIYIEEYASESRAIRFIKLNIQNLAGVPSIVYGILGLTLFVRFLGLGRSLLAGSLTMALLVLPVITIAAQEALRAVPGSFRLAGFGIGMTRWQVVRHMVLPVAVPGMLTGIILALSRAIGETAPLIMIGALTFVAFLPASPMDGFTVLPIQIFNWTSRPQQEFHALAASGIIVLLAVLLAMNAIAIFLRVYYRNKLKHLQ